MSLLSYSDPVFQVVDPLRSADLESSKKLFRVPKKEVNPDSV